MMRNLRDYGAGLKALGNKARALKAKKIQLLGELVISTGNADASDVGTFAGILLSAYKTIDQAAKEFGGRAARISFIGPAARQSSVFLDGEAGGRLRFPSWRRGRS